MIGLRLNDTWLTLADRASANVNLQNPFFDKDGAERLYTFPFDLDASPENLAALAHANRLDRRGGGAVYPGAELYLQGQLFATGILDLDGQPYSRSSIRVVFKNEIPDLLEELDKIKINEILETIEVQSSVPEAVWVWTQDAPPPGLFQVHFGSEQYSYDASPTTPPSEIAQNLSDQINADYPGVAIWTPGQESIRIASEDIDELGFDPIQFTNFSLSQYLTIGQQSQLRMQGFVENINENPDERLAFPYLVWRNFYAGGVSGFFSRINAWVTGAFVNNEHRPSAAEWKTTFVPFVRLRYLLAKIAEQLPALLSGYGGWLDTDDAQGLLVASNRALDQVYENRYPDANLYFLNGFEQSINLNSHVPDLTARELIQSIAEFAACWIKLDGKKLTLHKKQEQLNRPAKDWSQLVDPVYSAQRSARRGFVLQYPPLGDEDAEFLEEDGQLAAVQNGIGFTKIELPIASAKTAIVPSIPGGGDLLCPRFDQPGTSNAGGLGKNDISFRVLMDRGIQSGTGSGEYVMATHGNQDVSGTQVGLLTFDLEAEDGLYRLHHKGVLQLLTDGEPVTITVRLEVADLIRLRKWDDTRRLIRLPEGQIIGVIKSVQFKASATDLSIAKVVIVKEP